MHLVLASALAQPPDEARLADVQPQPAEPTTGVQFFGLAQTKGTATNVATTNPFFDGQVVGTLGGTSGVEAGADTSFFVEQRVGAFLGYRPDLLDGKAGLNGAFEVDFAWGDASYGIGGNTGGGFGGDQVNLQTRRLNADFQSALAGHEQTTVVGLQWLGDGVSRPEDGLDAIFRRGARGMVFASEAAAVQVFGRSERVDYRVAGATLVENASAQADDVGLVMADVAIATDWRSELGLHAWTLVDRSGGNGGALGVGPTSALAELQGASSLGGFGPVDATLAWLGADAGFNAGLHRGDAGVHGVVVANVGNILPETGGSMAVRGVLADVEGRWRYQPGAGSVLRGEVLYVSGDDPRDQTYTGFVTGNSYGVVGAVHATHGTLLLHPDVLSINRQVSQVGDVAAGGRGQLSLTGSLGYDPIPDRLTVQVGGGHAQFGGGTSAQEVNARVIGQPLLFLRTGLSGAYLARPDEDAWLVYASLDWLVI